ncbi:MAG: helix-turn-helix domain-containing protein, partial [Allorhizobium sp.]
MNTQDTISDIAAGLGYSEPSAFYRAFKKWMGVSPEAFRKSSGPVLEAKATTLRP